MNIHKVKVMSAPPRGKGGSPRPEMHQSVRALYVPAKGRAGRPAYPKYQLRVDQRASPLLPFAVGALIAVTTALVWHFGFARPAALQTAARVASQPIAVETQVGHAQPALPSAAATAAKPAATQPAPQPPLRQPPVKRPAAVRDSAAAETALANTAAGTSVESRMASMVAPRAAVASEIKIHLEQHHESIAGMPMQMYLAERVPILNTYFSGEALQEMQGLEKNRVEYERVRAGVVNVSVRRVSKDGRGAVVTLTRSGFVVDVHSMENGALLAGGVKQDDTSSNFYVEYDTELGRWKFARELPDAELAPVK